MRATRFTSITGDAHTWPKRSCIRWAREYWSSGRQAGKAKKNLEKYLELRPDDPDAQGDLGAFLYFADTLPGVVKFISKLMFMPSGDRDRGLAMLHYASSSNGLFETDHKISVAAINLLFEGKLREGTDDMMALIDRHPYYTRLAEPLGVLAVLDPLRIDEILDVHDAAIARHRDSGLVRYDDSLVKRMEIHTDFANLFFGAPGVGMDGLDEVLEAPPFRPDWADPLARLNRAVFYVMDDQKENARNRLRNRARQRALCTLPRHRRKNRIRHR